MPAVAFNDLVEAVLRAWRSQPGGNDITREPDSAEEAADLDRRWAEVEARRDRTLPTPFRELYRRSGGTATMAHSEIIFWPFDSIAAQLEIDPAAGWLQFADFRL